MWKAIASLRSLSTLPHNTFPSKLPSLGNSISHSHPKTINQIAAEFLKQDACMSTVEGKQSCLEFLKKLKYMRVQDKSLVSNLLLAMLDSNPSIHFLAPTYNIGRQLQVPSPRFYSEAETRFFEILSDKSSINTYEIVQIMSGLGNSPPPLSIVQKRLIDISSQHFCEYPDTLRNVKIYIIIVHTIAKISYGSPELISELLAKLPIIISILATQQNYFSLGVMISSVCRLKPNCGLVNSLIKPIVMQYKDDIEVKHLANIAFYLSEKIYYDQQFFDAMMPNLEVRVKNSGVPHFETMLGATKAKLKVIEYHYRK